MAAQAELVEVGRESIPSKPIIVWGFVWRTSRSYDIARTLFGCSHQRIGVSILWPLVSLISRLPTMAVMRQTPQA
jgi:hypothetical protein